MKVSCSAVLRLPRPAALGRPGRCSRTPCPTAVLVRPPPLRLDSPASGLFGDLGGPPPRLQPGHPLCAPLRASEETREIGLDGDLGGPPREPPSRLQPGRTASEVGRGVPLPCSSDLWPCSACGSAAAPCGSASACGRAAATCGRAAATCGRAAPVAVQQRPVAVQRLWPCSSDLWPCSRAARPCSSAARLVRDTRSARLLGSNPG